MVTKKHQLLQRIITIKQRYLKGDRPSHIITLLLDALTEYADDDKGKD